MKSESYFSLINIFQSSYEQQPANFDHEIFDKQKMVKIKIQFTQEHEIIYKQDELILRIDTFQDNFKTLDILRNLDQIKNLEWQVDYGKNKRKFQKWKAFWQGKIIPAVGGYQENEKKQGLWKELFHQYSNQVKIYEIGEYQKEKKCGRWIYIKDQKKNPKGFYNEQGQKQGKWYEFISDFNDKSKVTYNGEYYAGKKVGLWDTYFEFEDKIQIIGGGLYELECSIKIGIWIELSYGFYNDSQVIYQGKYNKNGQKIGRWDTLYRKSDEFEIIGGGQYEQDSSIKIGKWIEISDNFEYHSQVFYEGEYKNGKKVARWDILYKRREEFELIGGGEYNEEGSIKVGKWCELSDVYFVDSEVIYQGIYDKNGKKVGRWNTMFRSCEEFELIGGGQYDDSNSIKIGRWIELNDSFNVGSQVLYEGCYNKNGKKVGRWDILYRRWNEFELIGGGQYDEENYNKIGQWIELYNKFQNGWEITYNGEYNKNGQKVGKWLEIEIEKNSKNIIRSSNYDD